MQELWPGTRNRPTNYNNMHLKFPVYIISHMLSNWEFEETTFTNLPTGIVSDHMDQDKA